METASGIAPAVRRSVDGERAPLERAERARALYQEGLSCEGVAVILGVSHQTIWRDLRALGVAMRPAGRRPGYDVPPDQRRELVARLYREGSSTPAISRALGVSVSCVQADLTKVNVRLRPPPGRRRDPDERGAQRARAAVAYAQGLSTRQIAVAEGVSEVTVWRDLRASGVRLRELLEGARLWWDSDEGHVDRVRRRDVMRERWRAGSVSGAMLAFATGRSRQRWLGRWGGRKPPKRGARPRGRPRAELTAEQIREIHRLASAAWGRRAIADRLGVSEWAVRNVLESVAAA